MAAGKHTFQVESEDQAGNIGVPASYTWTVDTTAPTVTGVSSTEAAGTYGAGTAIPITVTFSEAVMVTGTPQLALNAGSGATANYTSGSGTSTLTFTYTVATGQTSSDLDYASTAALGLSGGTIKDAAGNAAALTLPAPGADGLAATRIVISSVPSFTLTGPTSGTFTAGQTVTIQWTAANVAAGSSVSLAYDTTSNWGNPKWIEIGAVSAANGAGSYSWNTSGIAAGTYYMAGYLYDANMGYLSHLTSAITIAAGAAAPSFTLTGPTSGTFTAGQTVTIQWTAANVAAGSSVSLAYDTTSNWGNPKWIEIGAVGAANGMGTYSWNTSGIAAGTYYMAGYLYDANMGYLSHLDLGNHDCRRGRRPEAFDLRVPRPEHLPRDRRLRSNGRRPTSRRGVRSAWPTTRPATGGTPSGSRSALPARPTGGIVQLEHQRHCRRDVLYGRLPVRREHGSTFRTSPRQSRSPQGPPPDLRAYRPTSGTFTAGQTIAVQWTDANVPSGSTVSLAYDTTSNWGNPKWIEIGALSAANGSGSYNWSTTGLAAGTYYMAGYLYTPSDTAVLSHLTTSFTVVG